MQFFVGSWLEYLSPYFHIQAVLKKGIQNKIIISRKTFIMHIYGLHHYKGKLSKIFSGYLTFSINFNVGSPGDTKNIQTIFDLVPRFEACLVLP
jgi:hypothetical protein